MKKVLTANLVLIVVFAIATGVTKLVPNNPDLALFANIGLGRVAVACFGIVQLSAGLGMLFDRSRRPGALVLALCNAIATSALLASHVVVFGVVSILFVAMALLTLHPATPRLGAPRAASLGGG